MKKRILAVLLSFCVAGGSILCPSEARAEEAGTQPASYMDAKGYAGLDAEFHTQEQIREYYNSHPVREMEAEYVTEPSVTAPYAAGELTEATRQDALHALNIYRYIAGVPEVSITDKAQKHAQAAALVTAINRRLQHSPECPAGMDKELYGLAVYGAFNSNLAAFGNKISGTIRAYMTEKNGDPDFGHRRQLLDYDYKEAGFGMAQSTSGTYYSATFVDANLKEDKVIAYPGQNQPLEYFGTGYAWTVIIPEKVDKSKINIKLSDLKTGECWNFNQASNNLRLDDDRGRSACAIFSPNGINYRDGDQYQVEITGIERPIAYEVNMFYLNDAVPVTSMKFQWKEIQPFAGEEHYLVQLKFSPENATNRIVTWSSSDPDIAEAVWEGTGVGRIVAKKPGTAVITATSEDGGHTASMNVVVRARSTGLELNQTDVTIGIGQSFVLSGKTVPVESSDTVHYAEDYDKRIIKTERTTIGGQIKVTGLSAGQTEIHAYPYSDQKTKVACRVNVVAPVYTTGLQLDAAQTELRPGESVRLSAAFRPSNVTCKELEWKAGNGNVRIGKVENGQVTATGVSVGKTVITAKALDGSNQTATCELIVYGQFEKMQKPEVRSYTSNQVILKSVAGCEYSMDQQNWQDSNEFKNLQPDQTYTFYIRKKATEYVKAGEPSEGATVKTRTASAASCLHKNTMIKNASKATCVGKGYTGDTYCADCQKNISSGKEIYALGHQYSSQASDNFSGTKGGVITYTCTRCGDSYTKTIRPDNGSGKTPTGAGTGLQNGNSSQIPQNNQNGQTDSSDAKTPDSQESDFANDGGDQSPLYGETDDFDNEDTHVTESKGGDLSDQSAAEDDAEMEGAVLTAGSYQYKVTGRKELAFTGYSGQPSSVIIPDTVKINGKSFKVTAIENRAFLNANIKSVSVGSALKEIGASAFQGCRKLKKVTLGSGVTKIGKNAFSGCKKLTTIKIRSAKLKAVGKNAWKGISKSAKIKVPSKKLTAYQKLLKNKGQDKKVKIAKL